MGSSPDVLVGAPSGAPLRHDDTAPPFFSVVVPVRDGGEPLRACLAALRRSSFVDWELWVVDDGSVDGSGEVATAAGATVLATGGGRGPGAARNLGAVRARGVYLFFLDADCEAHSETLAVAHARLLAAPDLGALFGSYDDAPPAPGLVSQYKNLLHHFTHQQGREDAATFWAGCGAVRRDLFLAAGGFDEKRWSRPAIEDIELGYRLRERGIRISLVKDVQVKHLKHWTFAGLLRSDVRDRALPWARLLLERRALHADLNIDGTGRMGAALAALGALGACLAPLVGGWLWAAPAAAGVALLAMNRRLYRFFLRRRGAAFTVGAIALHGLYHLYCAAAAAVALLGHLARRPAAGAALAEDP